METPFDFGVSETFGSEDSGSEEEDPPKVFRLDGMLKPDVLQYPAITFFNNRDQAVLDVLLMTYNSTIIVSNSFNGVLLLHLAETHRSKH